MVIGPVNCVQPPFLNRIPQRDEPPPPSSMIIAVDFGFM
jgi:hypothetical protein